MSKKKDVVYIYTDGACSEGKGGWAASLRFQDQQLYISGNESDTTNNRMELLAIINALKILVRKCKVELYSDSQYCVSGVNVWVHTWKKRNWTGPIKNLDLWKELYELMQGHKVTAHWVKGHDGNMDNEIVDNLAVLERQKL